MRHFSIIGFGLLAVSFSACGGSDSNPAKPSTMGATCKLPTDCQGGSVCINGTCVAPALGTGGDVFGGTGGAPFGGVPSSGGVPQGGIPNTGGLISVDGGFTGSGGSGTGGAAGDAGIVTTGGAPGDGAVPPPVDAGPVAVPGSKDSVPCGDTTCTNRDTCCGTGTGAVTYACAKSACSGAAVSIACDGPEDCASGDKCCQTGGGVGPGGGSFAYACAANCTRAEIGCGGPANCPTGSVCCATVTTGAASKTACEPGQCAQGEYKICRANSDCPTGKQCTPSPSPYLPGLRYCPP